MIIVFIVKDMCLFFVFENIGFVKFVYKFELRYNI